MKKKLNRFLFTGQILLTLLLVSGCSLIFGDNGGVGGNSTTYVQLESVVLTASAQNVTVDESVTFEVTPNPSNAQRFDSKTYDVKYYEFFVDNTRFERAKNTATYVFSSVGTFNVFAKYCTHQTHSDTVGDVVSNTLTIQVVDIDGSKVINVVQPQERTLNIPQTNNEVSQSWNYTFDNSTTSASFSYTAKTANGASLETGYFYFVSTLKIYWKVVDSFNNTLVNLNYTTTGFNLTLTIGRVYNFTVQKGSTAGPVNIQAFAPNGVANISNYSDVYDKLWYSSQKANYLYTTNVTGYYRFESDIKVYWRLEDQYGNVKIDLNYSAYSISLVLESGSQYKITIQKATESGDFKIKVNVPNPEIDISGKLKVYDTMRFDGQRNIYKYSPQVSSSFTFSTSYKVYIKVLDNYNNIISNNNYSLQSVKVTLDSSRVYTITIEQASTTGAYTLKIIA